MEVAGSRLFVRARLTPTTEPVRFEISTADTGPGLTVTKQALARRGLSSDQLPRKIWFLVGEMPEVQPFTIPSAAGWKVMDREDDPSTSFSLRKDLSEGVVGANFLKNFIVCLNPSKYMLGLGDPLTQWSETNPHPPAEGPDRGRYFRTLPIRFDSVGAFHAPIPVLELETTGSLPRPLRLALDTGSTVGTIEPQRTPAVVADGLVTTMVGSAGDADMFGGKLGQGMVLRTTLRAHGGDVFGATELTFLSESRSKVVDHWKNIVWLDGIDGVAGDDIVLQTTTVIDYKKSELRIKPGGLAVLPSARSDRVPVSIEFDHDGCPVVSGISSKDGTGRSANDVELGDVILAIENGPTCNLDHFEIAGALAGGIMRTKSVRVRLRRGKNSFDTVWLKSSWL